MKCSIIIPAYNCAVTLQHTVECLIRSGLPDFEIILVDDGSVDSTPALCDSLAAEHQNLRVIHQPNAGVSAARNRGLREAVGEYVLMFDADDSVDETAFARCAELLETRHPDLLIFGMRFEYYDRRGKYYRRESQIYDRECEMPPAEWAEQFLPLYRCNSFSSSCNKFIRRELLTANGISYDESYFALEDLLFVLDCLVPAERIYVIPEAIYRYKLTEDEKKVFRRMERIPSLSRFMTAFEERISLLEARFGPAWESGQKMLRSLYSMVLGQKLRFAPVHVIRAEAEAFRGSRYRDALTGKLAERLRQGKNLQIWLTFRKSVLRHRIANCVKRTSLYQLMKNRGNRL